ncbi:MAG: signal peptidase II [Proteobacteria bacterium]|nr:signal peptidase II [Pseudomonadota bacterium]
MDKRYKLLLIIAPLVIVSDQWVKLIVDRNMLLYQSIEVLENFFHITYIRNKGAAFGILSGADASLRIPFFIAVSIVAIVLILYVLKTHKGQSPVFPVALSLILGGAIGNMIDRVRMGEVIDFLDVHWYQNHWPAFNIADSAITVGMGFLIYQMITEKEDSDASDSD